eukprot:11683231-Alexandrium_andersonii.AAC.1
MFPKVAGSGCDDGEVHERAARVPATVRASILAHAAVALEPHIDACPPLVPKYYHVPTRRFGS